MLAIVSQFVIACVVLYCVYTLPESPQNRGLSLWVLCVCALAFVMGGMVAFLCISVAIAVVVVTYKAAHHFFKGAH